MELSVVEDGRRYPTDNQEELDYMDLIIKKALPANYNFEIKKSIRCIRQIAAKTVALQMPEGLLAWGCEIADILKFFCDTLKEVIIMADVTYGACCIDDITAETMGCDMIIHYGHSCLVPVTNASIRCLYVFVEITFSPYYLAKVMVDLFKPQDLIYLMGTIQYSNVLREAAEVVNEKGYFKYKVVIPQATPLLPGEVLGCTSPRLNRDAFQLNERYQSNYQGMQINGSENPMDLKEDRDTGKESNLAINGKDDNINSDHGDAPNDSGKRHTCTTQCCQDRSNNVSPSLMDNSEEKIVFIADGRFHLESVLIHNPGIKAFRFDPFNKKLSTESYNITVMHNTRQEAIKKAQYAKNVCLVLSMLGRQGNINILKNLYQLLKKAGISYHIRLLSEITIEKLEKLNVDAYIQVGCPRLSIDWGTGFGKPILNPYEAYVAFNKEVYKNVYPMDYYANDGGEWSNYTANKNANPIIDNKEAILRRLQQRAAMKQIQYST